jgi:transcriptional regulator with XRE-family HTH domain
MKHGTKCPACSKNGKLPPDAVRIRKACIEAGITYLELGEKASYSESRVRNIANGVAYNEYTAKRIADVAERIAKEKQ